MQSAVVYNPVTDEMYTAERGHGAYLNDKRLRVSARKHLKDSVIATGLPFLGKDGHERALGELAGVMAATAGVRRFGAASLDLAYVAAGRFDGFWERGLRSLGHGGGPSARPRGAAASRPILTAARRCSIGAISSLPMSPFIRSS